MSRLFAIILTVLLSLPICTWAVDDNSVLKETSQTVNTLDEDIIEATEEDENQFKQPLSKRKIAKKFLAAMGGVAISSLAIFFLLTLYNRIREGYISQVETHNTETSLETPDDIDSAIKTFLDKTDWKC